MDLVLPRFRQDLSRNPRRGGNRFRDAALAVGAGLARNYAQGIYNQLAGVARSAGSKTLPFLGKRLRNPGVDGPALPPSTKRQRTGGQPQSTARTFGSGMTRSRGRGRARLRRHRPRNVRSKRTFKRKRTQTRRGKNGRVGRFSKFIGRLPPIAVTPFLFRKNKTFSLYQVGGDSSTTGTYTYENTLASFLFRANDLVNPLVQTLSDVPVPAGDAPRLVQTIFTSSVGDAPAAFCGLGQMAARYHEHAVTHMKLSMMLTYRLCSAMPLITLTDTAPPVPLRAIPNMYVAWRISDSMPEQVQEVSAASTGYSDTVGGRMYGWRWRRITAVIDRSKTTKIKLSIPIRKFYKYPLTGQASSEMILNRTPSEDPAGDLAADPEIQPWSGPVNPCYLQLIVFAMPAQHLTDGSFNLASGAFICTFTADIKLQYFTKSTERTQVGCAQVPTFPGTGTTNFDHLQGDKAQPAHGIAGTAHGHVLDFTQDDNAEWTARQDA